ncbi:hypothetical protein LSTR_LSTR017651 [Laodelphax striatellus]|uniref:Uncharacterized protein n=1 Tax=Laodelphax striatellus TaxID=195883 RepID=A0A482XD04_LAOST|nr:hypothetical protein LSTR_LSTR017651 [Laodelphax striatellus]
MRGPLVPLWATLIVCLIAVNVLVSEIEAKRSLGGGRKSGSSSSTGGFYSTRKKQNNQQPQPTQHKTQPQPASPSHSSGSFLDQERKTGGHVGSNQPVGNGNRPGGNPAPIGFEHYNNRNPSAPLPPGHQPGGLGSAFGGAKPNNPPYPTHNNPGAGGFGSNPGGFGSNPGIGGHNQGGIGNSPGGFGSNTGGFGTGNHPQGGFNQPGAGGFGGTHHNSQPGFGNQPHPQSGYGNQPHYSQPGYGNQQHGYGGNAPGYHPPGNYPAGYGGQPHYGGGGGHSPPYGGSYQSSYNPGGFGGGGGYGQQGGYMGQRKSGPGLGTGLLGGAGVALPLGLLVGYGLGSMGSHSSPFSSSNNQQQQQSAAGAPAAPANNDAFEEWLKIRTAEEKKKEEAAIAAGAVAGGAAAAGTAGSVLIHKDGVTTVNETALVSRILEQTSMCPGGAGILEASFLNTLVPCNATEVDFQEKNLTVPYDDDCKTIHMTLIQLNPATNENKSVSLTIKQINVESGLPGDLAYDLSFDSCLSRIGSPEEKFCVNKGFTIDQYHTINETLAFLHTANFSISQFNTTLFPNMSCPNGAADCANKESRNLTSTFLNLSLLPLHPVELLMSQCMIFNRTQCDPTSTQPCDLPMLTVKQSIDTNTTLSVVDFASINFVLHGSKDIFLTFQNPSPPVQQKAAGSADQIGSSSTLTDTTTKSSATTI